jgi:outer membrane protein
MKFISVIILGMAGVLCASSCQAETLEDALIAAYRGNPDLQAQRARLRVTDEAYVQASAQFAPNVSLQMQGEYDSSRLSKFAQDAARQTNPGLPDYTEQNSYSGQLVISQPLYTSGKLSADLQAADADVRAGRAALRTTEANVLYSVILAYADVQRDQKIVDIRNLNHQMLQHQLDEAQARLKAGEITRTDVAQAEAQLADEETLVEQAQSQLQISRANFEAAVGYAPESLAPMPDLVGLPKSIDDCLKFADSSNPDLMQAMWREAGSHARIYGARAGLGPTVSAQVVSGYQGPLVPFDQRDLGHNLGVTATVVVPLYSGGMAQSAVRQAVDQHAADQQAVESARRAVTKVLATLWMERQAALRAVDSQKRRVDAAKIAFDGMRREYTANERSTLDVLISEETLRDAEISYVSAQHDAYVAGAAILQNMGWLEIHNMAPSAPGYDPVARLRTAMPKFGMPWQKAIEHLDGSGVGHLRP